MEKVHTDAIISYYLLESRKWKQKKLEEMSQQIRTLNTQGQKNPNPVIVTFAVISELTQRI